MEKIVEMHLKRDSTGVASFPVRCASMRLLIHSDE